MNALIKQFSSLLGAGIAAACCLGVSAVLATVGAVGLGFLIHDAYLLPIFVGFVGMSLWLLYRSARGHADLRPLWLALAGSVVAAVGLWLLVTGLYPLNWSVYAGLGVLVAGSVWDFVNGRRAAVCTTEACASPPPTAPIDPKRRAVSGAALAVVAAGVFYGLYRSVEVLAPQAEAGSIACYGINACKGQGWLSVSAGECAARGGVPLDGSPGDPAGGG